jgi:predicted transcriptional regulator
VKKNQKPSTQTAIRLDDELLERIDKVAERMSPPGVHVTRAEALRRSVLLGIVLLEIETKKR